MSSALDHELEQLFLEAEAERICLAPPDARIRDALARRLGGSIGCLWIVRPHPGIYARHHYWETLNPTERALHAARTLSKKYPHWIFSDSTAAAIYGWNVSYSLLNELRIVKRYHFSTTAATCRETPEPVWTLCNGIRVTTPEQTLFNCLSELDIKQALPIADSALRMLNITPDEAIRRIQNDATLKRRHYRKRVFELLSLANPLSESGGESVTRATMILLGFEIPDLQATYVDPVDPTHTMRADFRWTLPDSTVVLGELDGKQKYVDLSMTHGQDIVDVLTKERLRESRLSLTGARILRFSYNDVLDECYFSYLLESCGIPRTPPPESVLELASRRY